MPSFCLPAQQAMMSSRILVAKSSLAGPALRELASSAWVELAIQSLCVALSRAEAGMYVVGSSSELLKTCHRNRHAESKSCTLIGTLKYIRDNRDLASGFGRWLPSRRCRNVVLL
jgi:hypothetical protein